nr:MAG TPA: hypothetical protein [Caudoviricetes sp.]DAL50371.1 MAG TPA_asm: hypothetical protein [Caudoviricetes sp.]DAZ48207.1 MAG TPA: hypothetical protein [Caudoviricetes sp.]
MELVATLKTVIGRGQGTSAFAEVLFIWLQSS